MRYVSVGGASPPVPFRTALFEGLAPDGSLYVPERLPRLADERLATLADATLAGLAHDVLAPFVEEFSAAELDGILERALSFPIPLVPLEDDLHLLEVFHGPTLAFKDVGARFMAEAMSCLLAREERELAVLVATSGDTGSAVAHGFHGVPRLAVFVLYPAGRISELQERQITTVVDNVHALEVEGSFDDCQRLVKQALARPPAAHARALTTANSINVGRLLPQITYHAWAAAQLAQRLGPGHAPATVVVPSGNLGNLTAACYARHMGVPIGRLVAATNANDVLPEYLRTGTFTPRRSQPTPSSAMDVGDPSNLPRIQALHGSDLEALRRALDSGAVSDADTLAEIRSTYERTGVVLDPHTAVGTALARRRPAGGPTIVVSTAHPAKFPDVVRAAIGHAVPLPAALAGVMRRPPHSERIPARLDALLERLEA